MLGSTPYRTQALVPLRWIILGLFVMNAALLGFQGCQNAQDSGSTVTGRSLEFPSGDGVPFVRVYVDGEVEDRFQVTDSGGSYTMYHVPTGAYTVVFARFGLELDLQDLVIEQNDETYVVNLPELEPANAILSGTVTDSGDGTEVEGCDIWIIYSGHGIAHGVSVEGGIYEFTDLPHGETTVVAKAPGYEMGVLEDIRIGFEGVDELEIELDPLPDVETGTVSGMVRNEDGETLDEAYVGAFEGSSPPSIFSLATGEVLTTYDGYTFDLPVGTYTLVCTRSGYVPDTEVVSVEEGDEITIDFTLVSEESIWRGLSRTSDCLLLNESTGAVE